MFARQNQVRLPTCLLFREYSDSIIIEKRPDPSINPYSPRRTGLDPVSVGNPYLTRPQNQNSINKYQSPMQGDKTNVLKMDFEMSKAKNNNKKGVVKEALQPQEFLKMQQSKDKSRLWGNDSLLISDFEEKYFDLGSINKKDDCILQYQR